MILLLALILSILRHMLQNTNVIPLFCVAIYLKIPNRTVLKFHLLSSLHYHTFLLAQPVLTELRRAMTNLMSRSLQCLGCLLCSNINVGVLESQLMQSKHNLFYIRTSSHKLSSQGYSSRVTYIHSTVAVPYEMLTCILLFLHSTWWWWSSSFIFHSVDPYRITKSIWIWKQSCLLKRSSSEVSIKMYNKFLTRSSTIFEFHIT